MKISLPKIYGESLPPSYFPTLMQAVVFRNWEMVSKERIAFVLETDVDSIERLASDMGLPVQEDVSEWIKSGYITIIRANWHLLNYDQLLTLLDWDSDHLAQVLKEEDFLDIKLGNAKPDCQRITYRPLTKEEQEKTLKIKETIKRLAEDAKNITKKKPFDFYEKESAAISISSVKIFNETGDALVNRFIDIYIKQSDTALLDGTTIVLKYTGSKEEEFHEIITEDNIIHITSGGYQGIIRGLWRILDIAKTRGIIPMKQSWVPKLKLRTMYPFSVSYDSIFDEDNGESLTDELLLRYSKLGINGIWLPAVLYRMAELPFCPELSKGWAKRLNNLQSIVSRAYLYGIKIYLYLNEPRDIPKEIFITHPDMMGTTHGANAAMCIGSKKTQEYLENAIGSICKNVPELGGFLIISMGENLTLCKSKPPSFYDEMCPHCKDIPTWELATQFHKIIFNAMKANAPHMDMFFFDWGWDRADFGMTPEGIESCVKSLPEGAVMLSQRETEIPIERGGIKNITHDYAISVNGIGPKAQKNLYWAKESGHKIAGKMQVNTSWECCSVPYLPVFHRAIEQVEAMLSIGIEYLFLNWTVGGYPSPLLSIISEGFFTSDKADTDYKAKFSAIFGEESNKIWSASKEFSESFGEYPFDKNFAYCGPTNGGVSNVFYETPTNQRATMTCFAYDDLKTWSVVYPSEVLKEQYRLVCEGWKRGLDIISDTDGEFRDMAVATYIQLRSSYNQICYIMLRDSYISGNTSTKDEIDYILDIEEKLAVEMYKIMLRMPEVGFESANQYYITRSSVAEKLINIEYLKEYYK